MYREPQLHDLFDSAVYDNHKTVKEHPGNKQGDNLPLPGTPTATESGGIFERKTVARDNKAKRIVFFFDDGTFVEYFSG